MNMQEFLIVALMVVLLLMALLMGCHSQVQNGVLEDAIDQGKEVNAKVGAAATQATAAGQEIQKTAKLGQQATPPDHRPQLDIFWFRLIGLGQFVEREGEDLKMVQADIAKLQDNVAAGAKALAEEKAGRARDKIESDKKLTAANSKWEVMFQRLSYLAGAGIGIAVFIGVLMKDYRISVAGGAGGLAVIVACMIAGQIDRWLPWTVGITVGVVVLWVGIETWLRGSFKAAIKTNPLQDLEDLAGGGALIVKGV